MAHGFANIVQLIAQESTSSQPGAEVMLRRLTELLFIQTTRLWIEPQTAASEGWIGVLADQPMSTALGLLHQSPEHSWKVAELAKAVALSRSAFRRNLHALLANR
jgi:AraC-like DNA-binding protein